MCDLPLGHLHIHSVVNKIRNKTGSSIHVTRVRKVSVVYFYQFSSPEPQYTMLSSLSSDPVLILNHNNIFRWQRGITLTHLVRRKMLLLTEESKIQLQNSEKIFLDFVCWIIEYFEFPSFFSIIRSELAIMRSVSYKNLMSVKMKLLQ